jgi:ABC-type uncharacterized transport system substrate-binding protein
MVAAEKAKRILNGANPADIPVTQNHRVNIWLNTRLAEKIGFHPDGDLLEKATIVD